MHQPISVLDLGPVGDSRHIDSPWRRRIRHLLVPGPKLTPVGSLCHRGLVADHCGAM